MTIINEYFLIPPDWSSAVSYKRRWQTTLTSSLKADESRSALFTWPRRGLSFTLLTKDFTESAYAKRKLHRSLNKVWGIPFWMDETTLTNQANSEQKTLNVGSTLYRNFEVGAPCLLFSSVLSYEVGIIASKTDSQIVLVDNLSFLWAKGTRVYPVLKARIKSGQSVNLLNSRFSQMGIDAVEEYDDTITRHIGSVSGFPTYKSIPIFDVQPNWAEQGEISLIHPYDQLSYFGKSVDLSEYDETELLVRMHFLEQQKKSIQDVLDFFDSRMGRWGNFWTPSWQSDIRVTSAFGVGDNHLHIEDVEFLDYWFNTGMGTYVTMLFPDGTRINKQIVDVPSSTILVFDGTIGKACLGSALDGLLVSFLLFSRFNHDEIEVGYLTDGLGKFDLTFQTLFSEGLS